MHAMVQCRAMNTSHIRAALQRANLAEASRQTGVSVRRLFQLRDLKANDRFNVNITTYDKLDKWAKAQTKAKP